MFKLFYEYDLTGCEREFRRALTLNPNYAFAHDQFGMALSFQGRYDEAIAEGKRAIELDPLSPQVLIDAAVPFLFQRNAARAKELARRAAELDPMYFFPVMVDGWADLEVGKFRDAIPALKKAKAMESPPFVTAYLAFAYGAAGDRAAAMTELAELEKMSRNGSVLPFNLALVYLGLGDHARALDNLERALAANSQMMAWIGRDAIFDPIRSDAQSLVFLDRGTRQVSFWNLASRKVTRKLSADFAGSNDDWAATVVNHLLASGNLDGRKMSDAESGKLVPAITSGPSGPHAPAIALSPDGRVVAGRDPVSSSSTTIWELTTGRQLQTLRDTTGLVALAFSRDGRSLAAANYESITVWNVESGAALWKRGRSVEQPGRLLFYESQPPHALSLIVGSDEGSIQVWDSGSGRPRRTIHDDIYRLSRIQRGIGGVPLIGVARPDKPGLTFIDADSGMTLRTVPLGVFPYDQWTLSSDGNLLAHVSQIEAEPDQLAIIVSEFTTGRELRTFVSRSEGSGHLTFSRDNRWLLFSSGRSSALWDLTSGETKAIPAVREVDLSPDGQWLASYSDTLPTRITLLNLLTGAKRTVQASSPMGSIGFSSSGRYLTGGHDGPIPVWEVETGRRVFLARIDVATGWKSFCPDERCILTGSTTKPLQLWDIATGREMIPDLSRLMRGETHSFSPDMRWLATTASDGSVEIWDLAARTLAASLYVLNGGKSWLVRTPSGFFDVSDDVTKTLITWNVGNQLYPADRFWRQRHRPSILAALFAGRKIAIASTEGRR